MLVGGLRHWLLLLNLLWGAFVSAPWLAPVFMETGRPDAARTIYSFYSLQCHQLPQRSYFLFGEKLSYSLAEIQAVWRDTDDPFVLRQFIGSPRMGWKVAWSDRMVAMYTSVFLSGLLYGLTRGRLRPLPLWAFALLLLPMAVDGGSHLISDLLAGGVGHGFRNSNTWLAVLTGYTFPTGFYTGDALGSFNSWIRLVTGALFGIGVVGLAYPHIERIAREAMDELLAGRRGPIPIAPPAVREER